VAVAGVDDLVIRSLLDRQQYFDPRGQAQRLGISSAAWPIFGLLWPSGAQLAARLALRPIRIGERILEVGCGLALPSLVAHRRGADVTASDCHPLAASFLRKNLRLNALGPMKYRHGNWTDLCGPSARGGHQGPRQNSDHFDLIIGSDVLYERGGGAALAGFIERFAQWSAEVWIVDPDRANRPAFNRDMQAQGFALSEERLDCATNSAQPAYRGRLLTYRRAA
jgi:predicted nicotinamide N-methyase